MTYATRIQPFLAAVALPLLLGACVGGMPQQGDTQNTGITPLITYPVTSNDTPYSRCLAKLGPLSGYDNLPTRTEEHTSELQSLMRISYAVLCLPNKQNNN